MKKLLSLLLALAMCFSLFGATTYAADDVKKYSVTGWREFSEALAAPGNAEITLNANVSCYHDFASTGHTTAKVNGNKIVNLNGYTLGCDDRSNAKYTKDASGHTWGVKCYSTGGNSKTFIEISKDASLTIDDTSGKNSNVYFTGYTVDAVTGSYSHIHYSAFTVRDLFTVNGTLTINAGNLVAGNVSVQTVVNGADYDDFGNIFTQHYYGSASQQVWGTVATINSGAKVIVNGGYLTGRGYAGERGAGAGSYTVTTDRDAVLDFKGGDAEINGGTFTGCGGADVLGGNASGHVTITSGTFEAKKEGYVRVKDYTSSKGEYYCAVVKDSPGIIGISDDAISQNYKGSLYVVTGGKSYVDSDTIRSLELYETSSKVVVELRHGATSLLRFTEATPEMEARQTQHIGTAALNEKTEFSFNTNTLSKTLTGQGYKVKKSYLIRNELNKKTLTSKSDITGDGPVKFSYTFDNTTAHAVIVAASIYDKSGNKVGGVSYTYYLYPVQGGGSSSSGSSSSGTSSGTGSTGTGSTGTGSTGTGSTGTGSTGTGSTGTGSTGTGSTGTSTSENGPFSITIKGGYAETSAGRVMKANPGEKIKLIVDNFSLPYGQVLDKWVFQGENSASLSFDGLNYHFTMPKGNVSLAATYKNKPTETETTTGTETAPSGPFSITIKGGYAETSAGRIMKANPGEKIKLVVDSFSLPPGKVLDTWTFQSEISAELENDGTNYYFVMPYGNVSLSATYKEKTSETQTESEVTSPEVTEPETNKTETTEEVVFTFKDVPKSQWYYNDVVQAVKLKLVNGKSATEYKPNDNMMFCEAIKLAACMHQRYHNGEVTLENGKDVWYSTYMKYALDNKIIDKDYSDVANKKVTRKEYVYIFSKALPDEALPEKNEIPSGAIPDVKSELSAQHKAIYKFYRAGILSGVDKKGTFNPSGNIQRSEVAAILIRMMEPSTRVSAPENLGE